MNGLPGTRRRRPLAIVVLVTLSLLLCCGGGATAAVLAASYFFTNLGTQEDSFSFDCGVNGDRIDPNTDLPRLASLGEQQMRNAAVIILVGQRMNVPPRGWVIAIATAMQESWLRNLPHLGAKNDHDSIGLFQQRPDAGWGTPEQILNPEYAARKFYESLLRIPGWTDLPLTVASQKVQISAFPDAYAKHEPLATQVVNLLTSGAARAIGAISELQCVSFDDVAASGWTSPLKGPIVSRFRTAARPNHNGTDISAAKGAELRSASAGTVVRVRCNAVGPDGSDWGCYRDGGTNVRGCGWYVDIMHAGGIMTRYCHQVRQPRVTVGQQVRAGELIGWVGSTGHSSGPHLHYEVHTGGDRSAAGAVDPVPFMQRVGAPLGKTT
ncbi:MAG: M23 family metallopeptidase [Dactylosporangium sp.]|nr:M23 family metallopeptidase [Dactylosporangium sp.]NNJ63231.1 M23 family metallopeptidase [Dactylosporangium sp.]